MMDRYLKMVSARLLAVAGGHWVGGWGQGQGRSGEPEGGQRKLGTAAEMHCIPAEEVSMGLGERVSPSEFPWQSGDLNLVLSDPV